MNGLRRWVLSCLGLLLLCLTVVWLMIGVQYLQDPMRKLERLPFHNYLPLVQSLRGEKKNALALELVGYLLSHSEFPYQFELGVQKRELQKENSPLQQLKTGIKRLVRGGSIGTDDLIEVIGSEGIVGENAQDTLLRLASRMGISGTDPFSSVLFDLAELDASDVAVSEGAYLLRILSRFDAINSELGSWILEEGRASVQQKKISEPMRQFLTESRSLFDVMRLPRTRELFKEFKKPTDITLLLAVASSDPNVAYLTVENGGLELLRELGPKRITSFLPLLNVAAKKGPEGLQILKKANNTPVSILQRLSASGIFEQKTAHAADRLQQIVALLQREPFLILLAGGGFVVTLGGALLCFVKARAPKSLPISRTSS